jgi:DNA-binding CsgD family transcriptional regulator
MKSPAMRKTSLRPVPSSPSTRASLLEDANGAYERAEYALCRELLAHVPKPTRAAAGAAALVEARLARATLDFDRWSAAAKRAEADHPDAAGRLEATALRGLASAYVGRREEADAAFLDFERAAERAPKAALGMPQYFWALDAWLRADYDTAETRLKKNIEADAAVPESLSLMGLIEVKRERYARAGTHYMEVLRRLKALGTYNLRLFATALYGAANVAAETIDLALGKRVRKLYDEFVWPQQLGMERFNTLGSLRLLALLEGDLDDAWALAREAAVRAPSAPYAAIGEAIAAATSRLLGDERSTRLQLRRAWEIIRSARWGTANDETRVALTTFAIEGASTMPAEARKAMTLYQSLAGKAVVAYSLHRDRRITAYELMAAARVAEAQDHFDRAEDLYERSLENWSELHFDARAAIVALDLRRLTRDRSYESYVKAALARAPKAWFAADLRRQTGPLDDVSPAERLVLARLLEGKSAKAIASDLDRSVHTINNHTRQIFKAFGVTSRAAVLVKCASLGITPELLDRSA